MPSSSSRYSLSSIRPRNFHAATTVIPIIGYGLSEMADSSIYFGTFLIGTALVTAAYYLGKRPRMPDFEL